MAHRATPSKPKNEPEVRAITLARWVAFDELFEDFKQEIWKSEPEAPEKGMLKKFAAQANLTDRYASHLNRRYKPVGHNTARKIEAALGLPANWMDLPDRPRPLPPIPPPPKALPKPKGLSEFLELAETAFSRDPIAALTSIAQLLRSQPGAA